MTAIATAPPRRQIVPMRPPSERSRFIAAIPWDNQCVGCSKVIEAGKAAWYAKESGYRCRQCGRHGSADDRRAVEFGKHVRTEGTPVKSARRQSEIPAPISVRQVREAHKAAIGLLEAAPGHGSLTEKYRPRRLAALWGQSEIVQALEGFAQAPYPSVLLFEGETGTGKTSAALALAAAVGCDVAQKPPEFGGLHIIASGEQTADTIREIYNRL